MGKSNKIKKSTGNKSKKVSVRKNGQITRSKKARSKNKDIVFDFAVAFVISLILVSLVAAIIYRKLNPNDSTSESSSAGTTSQSTQFTQPTISESDIAAQEQKIKDAEEAARVAQQNYEEAVKRAEEAAQNAQNYSNQIASGNYTYTIPSTGINIEAPRSSVYAYASGAGSLLGEYYYKVSFVNSSGYESSLSPSSLSVSANNNTIWVSNVPKSDDVNVTQRRIYRTKGDGSMVGPYYLVKTLYDNSYSSSFIDDKSDSELYSPKW